MKKLIFSILFIFSVIQVFAFNDTLVRIIVKRSTYQNDIVYRIEHNATDYYDPAYDAAFMPTSNSQYPELWALTPLHDKLVISSFPFYTSFKSHTMGFKTAIADSLTLTARGFAKIDTSIRIYLFDRFADSLIDIRVDTIYKFYSPVYNDSTRFKLYFAGVTTYSGGSLNYGYPDSLVALRVLDGVMNIEQMNLEAYNVDIEPNAGLTVANNATLKVNNNLRIKSDITGEASLIHFDNILLSHPAIIEKYLADETISGWSLGIPVNLSHTDVMTGSDGIWKFDPLTAQWVTVSNTALYPLEGYVTRYQGHDTTLIFTGNLNNASNIADLIRTGDFSGNFGWNLVGNPYPATVSWDLIDPVFKENLNNAIYFRKLNGTVAAYVNGIGTNGGSPLIPPMQAFWVQVSQGYSNGILTLYDTCRLHSSQQTYKNQTESFPAWRTTLTIDNMTDEAVVYLSTDASKNFDPCCDAMKMESEDPGQPQLFTASEDGYQLSINGLSTPTDNTITDMGFQCSQSGLCTLNFLPEGSINTLCNSLLEDRLMNVFIDLSLNQSYSFYSAEGSFPNRFAIHISPSGLQSISNQVNDVPVVFYSNGLLNIDIPEQSGYALYKLMNTTGQIIATEALKGGKTSYNMNLKPGLYVLSLYNIEGKTLHSTKLIVNSAY